MSNDTVRTKAKEVYDLVRTNPEYRAYLGEWVVYILDGILPVAWVIVMGILLLSTMRCK